MNNLVNDMRAGTSRHAIVLPPSDGCGGSKRIPQATSLICVSLASIVSCRRKPFQPVLDWYAAGVAQGSVRVPMVVRDARLHGIALAVDRCDEETASSVEGTFEAWWGTVHPHLVVEETAAMVAEAERLRAIPEIANLLAQERTAGRRRTSNNVRIVATAAVANHDIATTGPAGFNVFKKYADVRVRVLPLVDA